MSGDSEYVQALRRRSNTLPGSWEFLHTTGVFVQDREC